MKLYRKIFILSVSALLVAGCGMEDGNTNDDVQIDETAEVVDANEIETEDEVIKELEKEIEALKKEIEALEESEEEVEEEEVEENEIEESNPNTSTRALGTRSQPVPVGETLSLTGTFTDYDADYAKFDANLDITIIDIIRGDEAWDIIITNNQFNDPAPEGKEYIINTVDVKLHNASSEDLKTNIRSRDFDYISSSGASYDSAYVAFPDELRVELYNNGSAIGNIVGIIDQDDNPLVRFESTFFFEAE